ncbi:MAG: glycerate kinase [Verrucomicrobia bacterium]|nr:glycerate kinase [Verrucomicrobiota bacterium]
MRVLIIPDKFKGTLTATQAARAIARGWRRARPDDELELFPMSDGGDGFGKLLGAALGARRITTATVDAAHRDCRAAWWWDAKSKTAVIETARIIGLAMLPPGKFHPFQLDTLGLGLVLAAARRRRPKRVLIGIGGSSTNDAGFGLARALGWRFLDKQGRGLDSWTKLHLLHRIAAPAVKCPLSNVLVAVDVQNPLLGRRGCSRIYGPQKGLRAGDFAEAERNLAPLAKKFPSKAVTPGAGAAGGLGFGLMAFFCGRLKPGFALFARHSGLMKRIARADVVITAEGTIDRSSLMGKGVGELVALCRAKKIPCVGLAGHVADRARLEKRFAAVGGLTDLTGVEQAKARPAKWLEKLAERIAADHR